MLKPSYKQGYARHQGDSAHPELWRGLVGAYAPILGNQGQGNLRDESGFKQHSTSFVNATWDNTSIGPCVNVDRTASGEVITGLNDRWMTGGNYSFAFGARMDSTPTTSDEGTLLSNFSATGTFTGLSNYGSSLGLVDGKFHHYFGSLVDGNLELFLDGLSLGSQAGGAGFDRRILVRLEGPDEIGVVVGQSGSKGPVWLGGSGHTAADNWDGPIAYFYAWNGIGLGQGTARLIAGNPLALFEKRRRAIGQVSAGGPTYTLTAESGSVAIAGSAVSLLKNSAISAGAGAVAISGSDVTLRYFSVHPTERVIRRATHRTGRYNFSPMGYFRLGESYRESSRAYRIQENSVVAEFADAEGGGGPTYTLTAESGSVSIAGTDAGLLAGRKITASSGSVAIAGSDATLLASRKITASSGSVSIAGSSVNLLKGYLLTAESGAVTIAGTDAQLKASRVLSALPGAIAIDGSDVDLVYSNERTVVGACAIAATIYHPGAHAVRTYHLGSQANHLYHPGAQEGTSRCQ